MRVRIHINEREKRPRGARGLFFWEIKHAQQYYEDRPTSDLEALCYMLRRGIEEDCKTIANKLKEYVSLFTHSL